MSPPRRGKYSNWRGGPNASILIAEPLVISFMEASPCVSASHMRLCSLSLYKWVGFCILIELFNEHFEAFILHFLMSEELHLVFLTGFCSSRQISTIYDICHLCSTKNTLSPVPIFNTFYSDQCRKIKSSCSFVCQPQQCLCVFPHAEQCKTQ